ncbi:uncharacterized protein LOC107267683 [Cephus cinctus]|uniref:Uncharacterized protein LOC107267683 n=1 Tax=Cephus cinctus TaxID=211228 RepID=A0AAJ7BV43_CEPCN|nr:uncharacterized protein LOC107267683 [Cephus cinctus]
MQDPSDDYSRRLYVRVPFTIKNDNQIKELFLGDVKVKLPRQSARFCHVVFPDIDQTIKNLKMIKKKTLNGKHIIAYIPKPRPVDERKERNKKRRKVTVPVPKPEPKATRSLFISNIKPGTKMHEIKEAFTGCLAVKFLKMNASKLMSAIIKMEDFQVAAQYIKKEREWPIVNGNKLYVHADTRKRKKSNIKQDKPFKIYNSKPESPMKNNLNESTTDETEEEENSGTESESSLEE